MSTKTKKNSTIFRLGDFPKTVAGRVVKLPKELAEEVTTRGRDVWLAGLGALATVEAESATLFGTLVKQGEKLVERGEQLEAKGKERIEGVRSDLSSRQKQVTEQVTGKVSETVHTVETDVTDTIVSALKRLGVPTRAEVRELSEKVDTLTRRVGSLIETMQKEPVKAAPRAVFSVLSREDGWAVTLTGEAEARGVYPTKDEALEAARALAGAHAPSQLVVHRKDGTVQDTLSYEA
jgi:poly(hydroxyalkanoate) granule-associated protein